MKPIGVLGLQGGFAAHFRALDEIGAEARLVRRPEELEEVSSLVLPGGESTTLLKLASAAGLLEPLKAFHAAGYPLFGTCAGMILLARKVSSPAQPSLALIDIDVERNAYGRQIESFETVDGEPETSLLNGRGRGSIVALEMVFIRAPRIRSCGPGVTSLARYMGEPVLVREGNVLAATFHPEMSRDRRVHAYFRGMLKEAPAAL